MGAYYGYIFIDRCVVCEILVGGNLTQRREVAENFFDTGICFS